VPIARFALHSAKGKNDRNLCLAQLKIRMGLALSVFRFAQSGQKILGFSLSFPHLFAEFACLRLPFLLAYLGRNSRGTPNFGWI
jgi:hypothetical protein